MRILQLSCEKPLNVEIAVQFGCLQKIHLLKKPSIFADTFPSSSKLEEWKETKNQGILLSSSWMGRNWACVMLVGVDYSSTSAYCWRMTCDDEFIILNLWSVCNIYKIFFSLENKIVIHNKFRLVELDSFVLASDDVLAFLEMMVANE